MMRVMVSLVALFFLLPAEALGQEGAKCLKEVLEEHLRNQKTAPPKDGLPSKLSICMPEFANGTSILSGVGLLCQYADPSRRIPGPIAPASLLTATLELTLCLEKAAKAAYTERDDGRYFVLPRETCRIGVPQNSAAGWALSASCAPPR